jgi:hypothetical protein
LRIYAKNPAFKNLCLLASIQNPAFLQISHNSRRFFGLNPESFFNHTSFLLVDSVAV